MTSIYLREKISVCIVVVIETIEQKIETLIDASKEIDLEVSTEKTKYMLLSRHQNAGQNHDIKIGNRCFSKMWHISDIRERL
jgi:hypothetical protein